VSLSCAREKNSEAVTNGSFCQALSVMQSYLRRPKGLAHYAWRRDNIVSHDLKAKVGARERSTLH
jgi:hypothetical protein